MNPGTGGAEAVSAGGSRLPAADASRLRTRALLRDYAALTRLYSAVPLALLCWGVGIAAGTAARDATAIALAIGCALAGGYAYNDLRDLAADRVNRPRRPLVRGSVPRRHAGRLVAVLFGAAAVLAATTASWTAIAFILLLIACSLSYSDHIKPVTGLKNAFVGVWCGVLPWGAALDQAAAGPTLVAVLIVALFVTQKELVADVYDREGDLAGGIRTIPVALGPRAALGIVVALNVASFLLARSAAPAPIVVYLARAGELAAGANVLALAFVFLKITPRTVRAYLEVQKLLQIGGCIALFAILAA